METEPSAFRYERKFLVDRLDEHQVMGLVKRHPSMFVEPYPPRFVNNFYLDTPDMQIDSISESDGTITLKGLNEALYRNLGRLMYPKRSAMAEVLSGRFSFEMKILPENGQYVVVYTLKEMVNEMYNHDELFYDCINFNQLDAEAIGAYNKSMDKLLKANFVFKNKRGLFAENSPAQFREASDHLKKTAMAAMESLHFYISEK